MRRTTALAIAVLAALPAADCSTSGSGPSAGWREVSAESLLGGSASRPFEEAVSAGGAGRPALIGGVVIGGSSGGGNFFPADSRRVALWSAPRLSGPWKLSVMDAVAGRDGPNETLMYLSDTGPLDAAFGWRNSPTEGYPRPSVWVAAARDDRTWDEVLEPREFFGGPSIVGFGGMSSGPHGYFVAGTWASRQDTPSMSVWHSHDGSGWVRDTEEPGFGGAPGSLPFGEGVADGPNGVLLIATVEEPGPQDPGAQAGAMWYSPDGDQWQQVFTDGFQNSTFDAVTSSGAGWVVAGTVGASVARRPAVWFVSKDLHTVVRRELGVGPRAVPVRITGISANGSHVVVAGLAGDDAILWVARIVHGVPGSWASLSPPPAAEPGLLRVAVSTGPDGTIVALTGKVDSADWTTRWH